MGGRLRFGYKSRIILVNFWAFGFAQMVDPGVAGYGKNLGRRCSLGWIELASLVPDVDHGLLGHFFRNLLFAPPLF